MLGNSGIYQYFCIVYYWTKLPCSRPHKYRIIGRYWYNKIFHYCSILEHSTVWKLKKIYFFFQIFYIGFMDFTWSSPLYLLNKCGCVTLPSPYTTIFQSPCLSIYDDMLTLHPWYWLKMLSGLDSCLKEGWRNGRREEPFRPAGLGMLAMSEMIVQREVVSSNIKCWNTNDELPYGCTPPKTRLGVPSIAGRKSMIKVHILIFSINKHFSGCSLILLIIILRNLTKRGW